MSTIAELAEDRVVEGVYAVARKRRLRTRGGSAYLALELVDPSGRIEGRVWNDVELLDARFDEGDAVRVLGRVERYRDRLQLEVRSIEAAPGEDPAGFAPAMRRDPDELDGAADVVQEGGGEQQVGTEPRVQLAELAADGRHADRVLEQPAGVVVMPVGCRRQRAEAPPDLAVGEDRGDGRP